MQILEKPTDLLERIRSFEAFEGIKDSSLEWLIEKLTELGVSSITPLLCDHSERKIIKKERLEKITISGLKQSQQFYLPKVNEMVSFKDFVIASKKQETYIAHCEESPKENLDAISFKGTSQTVMIGPEGDFTADEVQAAIEMGAKPVHLGSKRLRTETAAVVACTRFTCLTSFFGMFRRNAGNKKHFAPDAVSSG